MERISITPRENYKQTVEDQGFLWHGIDGYYTETAAYKFTMAEVLAIEEATAKIFEMCCGVVQHVIDNDLWDEFHINRKYADLIKKSWTEDWCSFYGRIDLVFNNGQIKLLEFNADTPTSLLEASVIQWNWLQHYNASLDQFNSIHEKLLAHMQVCQPYFNQGKLWFASVGTSEDMMTAKYLQDVAEAAGIPNDFIAIEAVSLDNRDRFCAPDGEPINNIFKLYPYEWMFNEDFGPALIDTKTIFIEPPYKAILSNKMLLVYLHKLYPDSPYILPAVYPIPKSKNSVVNLKDVLNNASSYMDADYVVKPVYSREGANVTIFKQGQEIERTDGEYGEEGYIIQQYAELPNFDGNYPVIGSWLIGGEPAGMGIREASTRITNNTSRFCSHFIEK